MLIQFYDFVLHSSIEELSVEKKLCHCCLSGLKFEIVDITFETQKLSDHPLSWLVIVSTELLLELFIVWINQFKNKDYYKYSGRDELGFST